jgi:PAS domain S-box-containing protein
VINWHAIALHFADRGKASAVVDRSLRIQLFSAGLERLLGWPREEVEGRIWTEAVTPPPVGPITLSRLQRALTGILREFESEALTPNGGRLRLGLEATLVGRGEEQALLLAVTSADPLDAECSATECEEVDYEISAGFSDFGRLISVRLPGRPVRSGFEANARCYGSLFSRAAPCSDCPAAPANGKGWPRTTARRLRGERSGYEVVTAEAAADRVRMRVRRISDESIGAIYDSRVRDLADSAQLSDRERAVLTYLLMGRSIADIAAILDISPRTVKFHQANILEKLGADSRADLIRLVT